MSAPPVDRELADLLFALWSRRYVLLLAIGVATALAGGMSLRLPKIYRATATLVITDAKMPATAGEQRPDSRLYSDTYAALLKSESVAAQVLTALDLARQGIYTPDQLANKLSVRPVPNTLLVTVSLDDSDAVRAATVVNALSAKVVDMSRALSTSNMTDTRDYLQEQVTAARVELTEREGQLQQVKRDGRFEESTKRLASLLELRGTLEENLAEAEQDAAKNAAAAASMQKALAGQDRLLTLTRSVVDDPVLNEVAGADQARTTQETLGLQMQAQQVNPLYERAEPLLIESSAGAAGANSRREAVRRQLQANELEVRRLEHGLAEKSTRLLAAQREYDLAKNAYETFTKSYESARLTVRAQVAEIKLVSAASPDPRPVGPRIALNVIVALTASAVLSVFAVLLFEYLVAAKAAGVAANRSAAEAANLPR